MRSSLDKPPPEPLPSYRGCLKIAAENKWKHRSVDFKVATRAGFLDLHFTGRAGKFKLGYKAITLPFAKRKLSGKFWSRLECWSVGLLPIIGLSSSLSRSLVFGRTTRMRTDESESPQLNVILVSLDVQH